MATHVIETQGLAKRFGDVIALAGLDLRVPKHAIFGFLGPNGAGKSTAMKLLLGLAKPTAGTGTIFGKDIVRDSEAIRARVGYLAQEPRYYPYMTARETLRFTARFFFGDAPRTIDPRIDDALELVGLTDKADRAIKGFSGGERQRLGIAQAQIHDPDLLILDEPAAALDPMGRRDVLNVMARLRERTTIVFSTHILDDVQRVSDVVGILDKGALVAQAPIEQLLGAAGSRSFTVTFRGDAETARAALQAEPWLAGIATVSQNGAVTWRVDATDARAAEARLLPTLFANGATGVSHFGATQQNLEDVFLSLVDGSDR